MPVLALQQQSAWAEDLYILIIRILVVVVVTYLLRSLYLRTRPLVERSRLFKLIHSVFAVTSANVDINLDDLAAGSSSSLTVVAEPNDSLSVRPPQPSYDPIHPPPSARVDPTRLTQSHECSAPSDVSATAATTPSQEIVDHGQGGTGENVTQAVGMVGHNI